MPELKERDLPSIHFHELLKDFEVKLNEGKNSRKGAKLAKSIITTFKRDIIACILGSAITSTIFLYNPILSHNIIEYITEGNQSVGTSLIYFFTVLVLGILMVIVEANTWNWLAVLGYNLSNTLSLLIYNKALKHPLLT